MTIVGKPLVLSFTELCSVCAWVSGVFLFGQDEQLGIRDVTVSEDKSSGSMNIGLRGATSGGVFRGCEQIYNAGEIYTQC